MWQKVKSWLIWILIKVRLFVSLKEKKVRLFVKKAKKKKRQKGF